MISQKILFYKRLSFKSKLIISYIFIISIPIIASGLFFYDRGISSIESNNSNIIQQRMQQEKVNIDRKLDDIENAANLLSSNSILIRFFDNVFYSDLELIEVMKNNVNPVLSGFYEAYGEVGSFRFLTSNEKISESSNINWLKRYENMEWFMEIEPALNTHPYYWEPYHLQRGYIYSEKINDDHVFSLYRIFNAITPSSKTYLQINVSPNYLFDNISVTSIGNAGYIAAVNEKFGFLCGTSLNSTFVNKLMQDIYPNKLMSDSSGSFIYADGKQKYSVHYEKLDRIDSYLLAVIPSSEYTAIVSKAKLNFLFIIVTAIFVLVGISYLITTLMLKRVKGILKAVNKIQNGNFDIHIPVNGEDEIDTLALDINMMAGKINNLINKVYKSEISQKEMELNTLLAQINPHFLYNTLETFKMMAEINNQYDISEGLTTLGDLIRYNTTVGKKMTKLGIEVENIKNYFKIMNLMLNNRIITTFNVDAYSCNHMAPTFLLQPIVENCIVHGFKDKDGPLMINIDIYNSGNDIIIVITDNGCGILPDKLKSIRENLQACMDNDIAEFTNSSIALINI
ncbi:MAG: Two-component sensor histidine kinase, partial [Candidatus Uhrbacteria bacterium GW2011_GWD2_52_7]